MKPRRFYIPERPERNSDMMDAMLYAALEHAFVVLPRKERNVTPHQKLIEDKKIEN